MLLKASQRGGAKQLANHILLGEENEHVEIYEVRGFTSENPNIAFQEMYALSLGTECKQFMFSLSMNPPLDADAPPEYFRNALTSIEKELGLESQPCVIVFHEKEGRRHAHCVWSRIDLQEMKAINLPFFKNKLNEISKQLYLEHDWELPKGYIDRQYSDPANFSIDEWQQAKRAKEDPRLLKQLFTQAWAASDSKKAFSQALKQYGFTLARGDRRGYVALDYNGKEYSLSRWTGVKSKQLKARLDDPALLPSIKQANKENNQKLSKMLHRHLEKVKEDFRVKMQPLKNAVRSMREQHHAERFQLRKKQKERWEVEERKRFERLPRGMKGIWHRITGKYQKVRAQNERETLRTEIRDSAEKHQVIMRQLEKRQKLQEQVEWLRYERNEAMLSVRLDMGDYLDRHNKDAPNLSQDFNRQAVDRGLDNPDFGLEID